MARIRICLTALAGLAAIGCGGEVDETIEGTLESGDEVVATDNSYVDYHTFRTDEGYQIEIQMTSDDFDTYLMLQGPDGGDLGQNDDVSPEDTSSALSLVAPASGTYTLSANSKSSGMTGAYQVRIRATEPAGH